MLKTHLYVPKLIGLPVMYLALSDYYAIYSMGFHLWTACKSLIWSTLFLNLVGINKNLERNAENVADSMYLH